MRPWETGINIHTVGGAGLRWSEKMAVESKTRGTFQVCLVDGFENVARSESQGNERERESALAACEATRTAGCAAQRLDQTGLAGRRENTAVERREKITPRLQCAHEAQKQTRLNDGKESRRDGTKSVRVAIYGRRNRLTESL